LAPASRAPSSLELEEEETRSPYARPVPHASSDIRASLGAVRLASRVVGAVKSGLTPYSMERPPLPPSVSAGNFYARPPVAFKTEEQRRSHLTATVVGAASKAGRIPTKRDVRDALLHLVRWWNVQERKGGRGRAKALAVPDASHRVSAGEVQEAALCLFAYAKAYDKSVPGGLLDTYVANACLAVLVSCGDVDPERERWVLALMDAAQVPADHVTWAMRARGSPGPVELARVWEGYSGSGLVKRAGADVGVLRTMVGAWLRMDDWEAAVRFFQREVRPSLAFTARGNRRARDALCVGAMQGLVGHAQAKDSSGSELEPVRDEGLRGAYEGVVWLYGLVEETAWREAGDRLALRASAGSARGGKAANKLRSEMPSVDSVLRGTRPEVPEAALVWLTRALVRLRKPGVEDRTDVAKAVARRLEGVRVNWDGKGRLMALLKQVLPRHHIPARGQQLSDGRRGEAVSVPLKTPPSALSTVREGQSEEKQLARFLEAVQRRDTGGAEGDQLRVLRAREKRRRRRVRQRRWRDAPSER